MARWLGLVHLFLFWEYWGSTQGFVLAKQTLCHLNHIPSLFVLWLFLSQDFIFFPEQAWMTIFLFMLLFSGVRLTPDFGVHISDDSKCFHFSYTHKYVSFLFYC
jgi:hypothetical protein